MVLMRGNDGTEKEEEEEDGNESSNCMEVAGENETVLICFVNTNTRVKRFELTRV